MSLLQDKVAVVTGASTGIGRAIMAAYCREGARVVAASKTASRLEEAAEKVRSDGGEVVTVVADLADDEAVGRVVDTAVERFGALDILVSSAGVGCSYRRFGPTAWPPWPMRPWTTGPRSWASTSAASSTPAAAPSPS